MKSESGFSFAMASQPFGIFHLWSKKNLWLQNKSFGGSLESNVWCGSPKVLKTKNFHRIQRKFQQYLGSHSIKKWSDMTSPFMY